MRTPRKGDEMMKVAAVAVGTGMGDDAMVDGSSVGATVDAGVGETGVGWLRLRLRVGVGVACAVAVCKTADGKAVGEAATQPVSRRAVMNSPMQRIRSPILHPGNDCTCSAACSRLGDRAIGIRAHSK